jgi:hypothetical protein
MALESVTVSVRTLEASSVLDGVIELEYILVGNMLKTLL